MKLIRLGVVLLTTISAAIAGHPKIAKDLEKADGKSTVDVIIRYRVMPGDRQRQKVVEKGGTAKLSLDVIKGAAYSVPVDQLVGLADDPDVAYISRDHDLQPSLDYAVPTVG
ncbi:MAG: hypothetical protein JNN08_10845, partial [Bryobacterales bacterium]|nr:hypothetical protein [Bryobacterales bacterium]